MMECLLSVDNAVVLAAQTRVLPTLREQEESLFYGIWGSYLFRFLVIGIKFFGKQPIHKQKQSVAGKLTGRKRFWAVVAQIEFTDIVFSVDSVLAALAVSSNPVIVLIGGLIGILCMRGIAEVIMKLMRKVPELEPMAYLLIAVIAVKLFLTVPAIDIEISSGAFGIFILVIFAATIAIHFLRRKSKTKEK